MYKVILLLSLIFINVNASLIGSNFSQKDLRVLDDLDIDSSFITDYKLQKTYNSYLTRSQDKYMKRLNNASLFIPKVKQILKKEGIPDTFLYMAMAESYFKIDAKSRVRATGMWQFMSGTAKMFGLKNNIYVDERMDIVKSTYAATKYLNNLHNQFDKWYLAAIAYNCGGGRVVEAITRATIDKYEKLYGKNSKKAKEIKQYRKVIKAYQQKRAKYSYLRKVYKKVIKWDVKPDIYELLVVQKKISRQYLPKESRHYIRKIISLAMMNNQDFIQNKDNSHLLNRGIAASNISTVYVKGGLHLENIASAIGMTYKDLYKLNKHIKRNIIPNNEKTYPIYIPYSRLSRYNLNKDSIKSTRYAIHLVKRGDTLLGIGRQYKISYKLIKKYNKLKSNRLALRQKIVIPFTISKDKKKSTKVSSSLKTVKYSVKDGDTLVSISKAYSIKLSKLIKDNNLKTTTIKRGDKIVIN